MNSMPFRIAIDASRSISEKPTGTETYSLRLCHAMISANERAEAPVRFSLYHRDRPPAGLYPVSANIDVFHIPFPRLWTHLRFAAELWRAKPEITFVPAHTLPMVFPGRAAVTVHDLGFKHFPGAHPIAQRAYLDATTRYSQARADLVFADSHATAADLVHFYATPNSKIRVIHPGVDNNTSRPSAKDIASVRAQFNLPRRYFLFVGTLQPRKNIKRIVAAFLTWQQRHADSDTGLVLAGAKGWLFDESWLEGAPQVHLTGYVSAAEKAALLAGAMALVFPSLYEGFGFPAVEAMLAGTPVIASNTSSLVEIVGESGILVDPLSAKEISAAMSGLSQNEQLRQDLIQRGLERAKRFTWESAAENALKAFRELGAPH